MPLWLMIVYWVGSLALIVLLYNEAATGLLLKKDAEMLRLSLLSIMSEYSRFYKWLKRYRVRTEGKDVDVVMPVWEFDDLVASSLLLKDVLKGEEQRAEKPSKANA